MLCTKPETLLVLDMETLERELEALASPLVRGTVDRQGDGEYASLFWFLEIARSVAI